MIPAQRPALVLALLGFGLAAGQALADSATLLSPQDFAARADGTAGAPINCTIKPLRVVELAAATGGIVAEVFVKPGDRVNRGDHLVRLDDRMLAAELAMSKARAMGRSGLHAAQTRRDGLAQKLARLEKAYQTKAISEADYEAAALDLALAQAEMQRETEALALAALDQSRVETLLAQTLIVSPVAGVLGEDLIDPGEAVGQKPVVTIYVNQPLRVEAFVPAPLLADFVAAQGHSIVVNAGAIPVPVNFDYAAQVADLASNTISVFFRLDAPGVLPGSKCIMAGARS